MQTIETDYLVVGAGTGGLSFTDSLITSSDADVVIVDKRSRPGGHWVDAYGFVRLHQPSAFYGVNSRQLGDDTIGDDGFYERATGAEVRAYFEEVLDDLVGSGRVRFLGGSTYTGGGDGAHRVETGDGETIDVRVRRALVDATYLESRVPATHPPSYTTEPGVRLVPVNGLYPLPDADGYTIIGAGKTAMDAVTWLLDGGVSPEDIRWIRPRDTWVNDRHYMQPLSLVASFLDGISLQLEAAAEAETEADLFRGLEERGQLMRIDPEVEPTMWRGAILSRSELEQLQTIQDVIRLGRVRHIGVDAILLDHGEVAAHAGHLYVDCTAEGIATLPSRPIFEPGRITLQPVRGGSPSFNSALIAFLEASRDDDAEKNRLTPPTPYPRTARDWIVWTIVNQLTAELWGSAPDIAAWVEGSRTNAIRGFMDRMDEPLMQAAMTRLVTNRDRGMANLERFAAR